MSYFVCHAYYEDLLQVPGFNVFSICLHCRRSVASHPHSSSSLKGTTPILQRIYSHTSHCALEKLDILEEELMTYIDSLDNISSMIASGNHVNAKHCLGEIY